MKKKLISFFTVFCLLVTSASENVFDLKTSAVEDMRKYVIFDAEPLKAVSGEDNSATPDWAKDADVIRGPLDTTLQAGRMFPLSNLVRLTVA